MSSTGQAPGTVGAPSGALVRELFVVSGAAEFGLSEGDFGAALAAIRQKYLPSACDADSAASFYRALHLQELALARACAAGNEKAWEVFLTRYREKLYDAARAITREDSSARELADSLYAELYGAHERDGKRISKLAYYNGRGSLEGWLRATLAQEHVNFLRRSRHEVSLEEKQEAGQQFAAVDPPAHSVADVRLAQAADEALATLAAEARYILAAYYLDGRTLAEIARVLHVHESTISRKLEKITGAVRKNIVEGLMRRGMSRAQAEEALEVDVRDLTLDVRARLTQEKQGIAFPAKDT